MKPRHTLALQLLLIIGVSVTTLWLILASWLLYGVRNEVRNTLDDRLAASAQMVASLMRRQQLSAATATEVIDQVSGASPEYPSMLACRVSDLRGEVLALSKGAPQGVLESVATDGYVNRAVDGEVWRVYTLTLDNLRIATADRVSTRESLLTSVVLAAALPFGLALAGTLVLLWFGIRWGLKPLQQLSYSVATRDVHDSEPLTWAGGPAEVKPLVDEINRLLLRVQQAVLRERRFTGDAAHELRTPLTAIKTQLQVARITRDASAQHALQQAEQGVERLQSMLDQLLLLARLEGNAAFEEASIATADEIGSMALSEVITKAEQKKVRFVYQVGCSDPIATPGALAVAALRNLLDNAIKASPLESQVSVVSTCEHGFCTWTVQDQGLGVTEEQLQQLVNRFVHFDMSGSGLGLAIVQTIVNRFGGKLVLANIAPRGFEARLTLPLLTDER